MAPLGYFLRLFGVAALLAIAAGTGIALAPPALAQYQRSPFDSFFRPFSAPRYGQPEQRPVDYSRAPPARKQDTQPTDVVLVLGDSMADWLAYGLEDALSDSPELGVVRKHRTVGGLVRYDSRNESLDWAQAAREAIAVTKPKFIVMMVGLHDRQTIRVRPLPQSVPLPPPEPPNSAGSAPAPDAAAAKTDGPQAERPSPEPPSIVAPEPKLPARTAIQTFEFRTEQWAEQYSKRIDATIAALKGSGVPVFWVGLPAIRGPKSTGDMQYLDELFRTRVEKAGVTYIDVWDGFVDENGRFVAYGPDFEGQTRRLRAGDGMHFTKAGARKLAHFVEREIRRVMTRGVTTVALPTSEPAAETPAAAPRPGMPVPRPLAGPVLPLTAPAAGQQDLAGGEASAMPHVQPIATRVLQKGEAVSPPAGRSDDFKWPRREIAPFGTDPVVATTTDPIPVMQAAPATTVPVPGEESRPVTVTAAPRRVRPVTQQAQRRPANTFNFFPFFR
jgi:hypothetical protein